jgi:hypothetical protein
MTLQEITSVGWLNNHDGSVCLVICSGGNHVFVTISKKEFEDAGGIDGLESNKQLIIDFYNKCGAGRP